MYKLFTDKTEEEIGKILNKKQHSVNTLWTRAKKQGENVII